ncbi:MAG TPA: cytochrome c peroxidase [Gemmataceae bacterium]|nr:cytochrome c peroxidase [Gemmataceae bacterium]
MSGSATLRKLATALPAFLLLAPICGGDGTLSNEAAQAARLRRPVALALTNDGRWLYAANRTAGTISTIDTTAHSVVSEIQVGKKLSDLALTADGRQLLACDEELDALFIFDRQGADLHIIQKIEVGLKSPVSVSVNASATRCYVAGLWAREVLVVDLSAKRPIKHIALPFPPRRQLLANKDAKLIVTDSFGGRLAVINLERDELESVRALPAHNIRGLALSRDGKELLVAHQTLNGLAHTTFDDVHWGNLLTNNVRVLQMARVLSPAADLLEGSRLHYLGDVGHAAGDPAQIVRTPGGTTLVALAGVGEVAIAQEASYTWERVAVGRGPGAIVVGPEGHRAYVANEFSDSVSVVDLPKAKVIAEISLGKQGEVQPRDRGEMLFHDARLAHDGWLSCHSCHTDGHTNGLLNDNLGDGSFGAPKRVLSLLGSGDTAPYAWLGSMPDLESQVRKSILTTMHGRAPSDQQVQDLAAFLRSLPPPPALASLSGHGAKNGAVERGRAIFRDQGCVHCHAPPAYTSSRTYDVGLHDEVGNTHFNPPSLRGVSQGGPYFHDNRARTLEEVVAKYRHQLKTELSKKERQDLVSFLRSL